MQLTPNLFSSETFSTMGVPAGLASNDTPPGAPAAGGVAGAMSLAQRFGVAFPRIMWAVLLFRVAGYCAKNYFMINRQARKRTTTYAGKHAAFSAELETAEMLKTTKDMK
jgi:hypothetical protein